MDIHRIFETIPYNIDKEISKEMLPTLPSCFKQVPFYMGLPGLGMHGQHRCSCMNLHAYDFGNHWEIHKDKNNPFTQPMEHLIEDAPNVLAAVTGAVIVGALEIGYLISKRPKDEKKPRKIQSELGEWWTRLHLKVGPQRRRWFRIPHGR